MWELFIFLQFRLWYYINTMQHWWAMGKLKVEQSGFTLVEILIVIGVIGILTAISFVAYNGLSDRGEDASRVSALDQYTKAILLFQQEHGRFPNATTDEYHQIVCLGDAESYPATEKMAEGVCWEINDTPYVTVDDEFHRELETMVPTLPNTITPEVAMDVAGAKYETRGAWYVFASPGVQINYVDPIARENSNCARGELTEDPEYGFKLCTLTFSE